MHKNAQRVTRGSQSGRARAGTKKHNIRSAGASRAFRRVDLRAEGSDHECGDQAKGGRKGKDGLRALNRRDNFNSSEVELTPAKWEIVSGSFMAYFTDQTKRPSILICRSDHGRFIATDRLRGDIGNGVMRSGSNSEPTASTSLVQRKDERLP
jgi:hypothetical protein